MSSIRIICSHFYRKSNLIVHKTISSYPNANIILGLGPILSLSSVSAQQESNTEIGSNENIEKQQESGWDRLCSVFKRDEFGNYSKEMNATIQATCMACFIGLAYGGVKNSRTAYIDFIERNQATMFENIVDAKRRCQNHVTIHFAKGAFKWATRLSLFTGGFMLVVMCAQAYQGRSAVLHYAVSGSVVGALLRLRLGPPAIIVGGFLGGILGLVCGLSTKTLLSLSGTSLDDILAFQHEIQQSRERYAKQIAAKGFEQSFVDKEGHNLLKDRPSGKEDTI